MCVASKSHASAEILRLHKDLPLSLCSCPLSAAVKVSDKLSVVADSARRLEIGAMARGDEGEAGRRRASRSASVNPLTGATTACPSSLTYTGSSLSGSSSPMTMEAIEWAGHAPDQPRTSHQMTNWRGSSSSARGGAAALGNPSRGHFVTRSGGSPAGRSRSPGTDPGMARVHRRVQTAQADEAMDVSVTAEVRY